jgi:hypothetical protein
MASSNLAVSTTFGEFSTYVYPAGYDQTKLGLGPLMMQACDDYGCHGTEGHWVGPIPINVVRPIETPLQMPGVMPDAFSWSSTWDYIIVADNAGVSTTRRFGLYSFNKTVRMNPWGFKGAITCTTPINAGNYTNKGHRVSYEKYTTGTIAVNNASTTVTGTLTLWADNRIFAGSRIGFGTTDPTAVTTWYEISPTAAPANGSITLSQPYYGANLSGASYVIEDLRILYVATNSTAANAGLYMVAGIHLGLFAPDSFTVGAAGGAADRLRGVFWLSDGGVSTNTICKTYAGIAMDTRTSWTNQMVYCLDSTANARIQVVNFRAAMTLASGRDTNSGSTTWNYNTGLQSITGSAGTNALVLCTPGAGGGPSSGVKSLFFITTTRWYSAIVANVTTGSTTFLAVAGGVTERPPGNAGGNGSGATVTYTQSGAGLATITAAPVAAGSGYPLSSTVYLAVGIKGTGATVNITATDGVITAVVMNAAGSGYPASATVSIYVTGGGGNGGIVSGSTNGSGVFTSIGIVVSGGTNYTTTAGAATTSGGVGGIVSATTTAGGAISSFNTTPMSAGERYPGMTGAATTSCTVFANTGALNSIAYDSVMDRFMIFTTAAKHYITQYREDGGQWDRIVLQDLKQINISTMDASAAIYPSGLSLTVTGSSLGGMTYLTTHGTTNITNFLYNVPFAADWEYTSASNCCVVLPVMDTSAFATFVAGYFNAIGIIGNPAFWMSGRSGTNLGLEPGAVRMSYRTSGISDNSGVWTLLDYSGLLGITATATIQIMLEFRMCTGNALPARVTRVAIEGTAAADTHFQFSTNYSDVATSKFAWRYYAAFDGTVPKLYISVYNGITNALILSDDSVTQAGTWEKSTDGSSWGAFDTSDRTNETTYLRWTPVSDLGVVNAWPILGLS